MISLCLSVLLSSFNKMRILIFALPRTRTAESLYDFIDWKFSLAYTIAAVSKWIYFKSLSLISAIRNPNCGSIIWKVFTGALLHSWSINSKLLQCIWVPIIFICPPGTESQPLTSVNSSLGRAELQKEAVLRRMEGRGECSGMKLLRVSVSTEKHSWIWQL